MSEKTLDLNPTAVRSDSCVRLSVVAGPHSGMHWAFDFPTEVTIGREHPSNIILDSEPAFSRKHVTLQISPPKIELVDQESRNGTFVNGVRLARATLHHGDKFGVGQTEFLLEVIDRISESKQGIPNENGNEKRSKSLRKPSSNTRVGPVAQNDNRLDETIASDVGEKLVQAGGSSEGFFSDASPLSDSAPQAENQSVGDGVGSYDLLELLGRGGMAVVYRGKHRRTGQPFAIKLIRGDLPKTDKQLQLFVREAGVLTQLEHARIVKAIEFGIEGRTPYLVMEFIDTIDLLKLVDAQSSSNRIRTSVWTISRILEALHHAHNKGFVHRDVKPANILAYREAHRLQVKLADFGLAKLYGNAGFSGLTNERSVRGTVAYMAPEQFNNSRDAGPSEDVFSCGACLYRLVIGKVPNMVFHADETMDLLDQSRIPESLRCVLRQSLQAKPEERFQSAKEFLVALHELDLERKP